MNQEDTVTLRTNPGAVLGTRESGPGNDNPVAEFHAKPRTREASPSVSRASRLRVSPALAARNKRGLKTEAKLQLHPETESP